MYGLLGIRFLDRMHLNHYWAWEGVRGGLGEAGRPSMHLHTIHTPGHGVKDHVLWASPSDLLHEGISTEIKFVWSSKA